MKNISFLSENFQFLEMKFSIFLNRLVFVMWKSVLKSDAAVNYNHIFSPYSNFLPHQ